MKILVVKPSSLGDVIHSLPFVNALKKTFTDSRIDWVISRNLKGILKGNPLVDALVTVDKDSWKKPLKLIDTLSEFLSLRRKLKSRSYDVVIDLQQLIVLIDGATVFISNDSGLMHIAAALGVPLVALFGPTDPVKTGPYGWQSRKDMKVITAGIPCRPSFKKRCSNPLCMKDISVETVSEAVKELLSSCTPGMAHLTC